MILVLRRVCLLVCLLLAGGPSGAGYLNFEVSHVHPIDLTPSGDRLLAVNTPDALLEVFLVGPAGELTHEASIKVGLEPVTVVARTDSEAWVVNNLSDSVSIVDLAAGVTVQTLKPGDEPTDVAFAAGKAFVSVSQEDAVKVYTLSNLAAAPALVPLQGRDVRALAVSNDGNRVYATVLRSGNQTTEVPAPLIFDNDMNMSTARLTAMGLSEMKCDAPGPNPYPPLPPGITRNPALTDPPSGVPEVGLIVQWNEAAGQWQDEAGQDWTHCLHYRVSDHDLFVIDAGNLSVTEVDGLGTSLFEVSVRPDTTPPIEDLIYVPNTDARNIVRFEHELGVRGHVVDNLLSVVDPQSGNAVTRIDLNAHIDRASDPATNLAERLVSISQPGMMAWRSDGSVAWLSAIGSRKVFRVDGSCLTGSCIFGAGRATPDAVEVGEGPTGVALLEGATPAADRLYVLNRIDHSIAVVDAASLTKIDELPLHDPSPADTRDGRRFLYDAIDTSGHGDAACSSCHLSGDLDGLAWDLGDPSGDFVPYSNANDNVRFVFPVGGQPVECGASPVQQGGCASNSGFDPQKGPMTTQTLRGMLEPLHWRGDRATMNDFNAAFVGLMGTADVGPINGKPAGLSAQDMETFRQFALALQYPPNPVRNLDDTTPCGPRSSDPTCEIQPHGALLPGNPTQGRIIFDTFGIDAGQPCQACHTHPFGAGGGKLGGVDPTDPGQASDTAALFNGAADQNEHNDVKIAHMRNMYDKFGPVWADPAGSPPDTYVGFGYVHDGGIPDLYRFLSIAVFNISTASQARDVRDLVAFSFAFPSGTRPATGAQVTLPAGTPPTGPGDDEALLTTLLGLGDLNDGNRHCELTATTVAGGRARSYHLSGGSWVTDVAGESPLTTVSLRQNAAAPITFTCATLMSGQRLGGNRDEDVVLDGDDCAAGDARTWRAAETVEDLLVEKLATTRLFWSDQSGNAGPSLRRELLGADLDALHATGIGAAGCLQTGLETAEALDARADPAPGQGYFYLVRPTNPCGPAPLGPGRGAADALVCSP